MLVKITKNFSKVLGLFVVSLIIIEFNEIETSYPVIFYNNGCMIHSN